ncbi:hypothetical protein GC163_17410 [bacterium]|nr:hypothetical protein [bacterium]
MLLRCSSQRLCGSSLLSIALLAGCGGETPTATPESAAPTVDLGAPADSMTEGSAAEPDMRPVLPIPDDAPGAESAPAEAPVKPIPEEPAAAEPPAANQ